MKRGLAYRRKQDRLKKKVAAKRLKRSWRWTEVTPDMVGYYARTPKPCSCDICGNARKHWGEETIQERKVKNDNIRAFE